MKHLIHKTLHISVPFQVLVLANALVAIIVVVLVAPTSQITGNAVVIGAEERVRLTSPAGDSQEVLASINTGITGVTIDRQLAEALGLELAATQMVMVQTSTGLEHRPVVEITIEMAGRRQTAMATVADRTGLITPVLIGRNLLTGMVVTVDQTQLTTPGSARPASTFDSLLASSTNPITPVSLVALFPLAAVVVVMIRNVVGLVTLGTFAPILIAFSMLQLGILPSLLIFGLALIAGLVVEPLILRRYRIARTGRLGVLIGVITLTFLIIDWLAKMTINADTLAAVLPLVITSVIIERLHETWEMDGLTAALKALGLTLAVSMVVMLIMVAPVVRYLADAVPLPLVLACVVWIWLLGAYRGLRLTELLRFRLAARMGKAL
jgi:hypothetical protein